LIITILLIFVLPKKYIVVPILLCVILVPWTQALYLFGFHLFVSRIIFFMAFGRVLMGSFASTEKMLAGGFTAIDKFFLLSVLCEAVGFILLYLQAGAVIYQAGGSGFLAFVQNLPHQVCHLGNVVFL